jgi:hypothetical protein
MVAPLKERGLDELKALQRRTRRLYALERITPDDHAFILEHLNEVEARIQVMNETDAEGGDVIPDG